MFRKIRDTLVSAFRQRRWTQNFWGNTTEAVFAGLLILLGMALLAWSLVGQLQGWPEYVPLNWKRWIIRGIIYSGLLGVGLFRLVRILFLHSGSAEQRSNFLNQAFDLDYLRSDSSATEKFPGIRTRNSRLRVGERLPFAIESNQPTRWRF